MTVIPATDELIILNRGESMLHELQQLARALQTSEWHAFLKAHGALVEDVESSLMMPAPFSPWR